MIDMICFAFCEEKYTTGASKMHIGAVLKEALHHKPFLKVTVMWTAWCFTSNIASPYMNRYSMNEMGLSFMEIMIFVTMAASVGTMLTIRRWGRLIGTIGSRKVMLIGCIGTVVTQGAYMFAAPHWVVPQLIGNLFGAMFWSGCNLAANSLQLSAFPEEGKASYIALFSCATCLLGTALGTLTGGTILEWFHAAGLFIGWLDRYKALLLLGIICRMTAVLILVPKLPNDDMN